MHCEITDCYFNVFFVEMQLKKENMKSVFFGARVWAPKSVYRSPNRPKYMPWHETRTITRARAITRANQEKGRLDGR